MAVLDALLERHPSGCAAPDSRGKLPLHHSASGLGGGRHEGLVGLSYRITGSAANPVLNVNPLSVLAPGFLRQIFGAFDGSAQNGAKALDPLHLGQD